MKNKEKYAKEIVEIACNGSRIAVMKGSRRIVPCDSTDINEVVDRILSYVNTRKVNRE